MARGQRKVRHFSPFRRTEISIRDIFECDSFSQKQIQALLRERLLFPGEAKLSTDEQTFPQIKELVINRKMQRHPHIREPELSKQSKLIDDALKDHLLYRLTQGLTTKTNDVLLGQKLDYHLLRIKRMLENNQVITSQSETINRVINQSIAVKMLLNEDDSSLGFRNKAKVIKEKIDSSTSARSEVIIVPDDAVWVELLLGADDGPVCHGQYSPELDLVFVKSALSNNDHIVCHELVHGTQKFIDEQYQYPEFRDHDHFVTELFLAEMTTEIIAQDSLGITNSMESPYYTETIFLRKMLDRLPIQQRAEALKILSATKYGERAEALGEIFNLEQDFLYGELLNFIADGQEMRDNGELPDFFVNGEETLNDENVRKIVDTYIYRIFDS